MLSRRDLFKRLTAVGLAVATIGIPDELLAEPKRIWALGAIPQEPRTLRYDILVKNNAFREYWVSGIAIAPLNMREDVHDWVAPESARAWEGRHVMEVGTTATYNPRPLFVLPDDPRWLGPKPGEEGYTASVSGTGLVTDVSR